MPTPTLVKNNLISVVAFGDTGIALTNGLYVVYATLNIFRKLQNGDINGKYLTYV